MIPVFLRKSLMTLAAILTLGAALPFMPSHTVERPSDKGNFQSEKEQAPGLKKERTNEAQSPAWSEDDQSDLANQRQLILLFSIYVSRELREQGLQKFGARIRTKIGDQYVNEIVPAFLPAIKQISSGHDATWVGQLAVTHEPASGMGERILHVYQRESGQELLKLHVRRDHPPQDGFWFDFHYHTIADHFQKHHPLKRIYWGKDTPPKWTA